LTSVKADVLNETGINVLTKQLIHTVPRKEITAVVLNLAMKKYSNSHLGIDFTDIEQLGCKKSMAQSILKRMCIETHDKNGQKHPPLLFRSLIRSCPQTYYPASVKADVIEFMKKKKLVPTDPTEVTTSLITPFKSRHPLSKAIESGKANSFLEALMLIPFQPAYIHNIHLQVDIDRNEYEHIIGKEEAHCRSKGHEERIGAVKGMPNVMYMIYPKGRVMVYVKCSENPFRLETENDVSYLFSFLGQVRDRMVIWLRDLRETVVPSIMNWRLLQCDINRDVELTSTAQITLPDIQLKYADRVFRLYVESRHDKAIYRAEEFLNIKRVLPEALECIINPFKSVNAKLDLLLSLTAFSNKTQS
jgi:hypothetical protein